MSTETELRAASARFYDALNAMAAGDAAPMAAAWAQGPSVSAQHPIGGREEGFDAVIASFAGVASVAGGGEIALIDRRIDIGSDLAVETGIETGHLVIGGHRAELSHRVTNVYRREEGAWRLAHHHTDLSPALLDVLARLGAAT